MAIIRERENARFSDPVNLRIRFYKDGQFYDPEHIDRVEIWKHGESEASGGILVDVIDGSNAIRDELGHWRLIYDPYLECGSPACLPSPNSGIIQAPYASPTSPVDPRATIVPDARYYDRWVYNPTPGYPEVTSRGNTFYLYPDNFFSDSGTNAYRYEIKPDRKMLVKGESLDMRLRIIPIPLHRARRRPIVDYLVPISTVEYRWIEERTKDPVTDWTTAGYNGMEAIIPTDEIGTKQLGTYLLKARLNLPNGQVIQYRMIEIALID